MGSLNHRTLLQFIEANDLPGLRDYLINRSLNVDDRDEVSSGDGFFYKFQILKTNMELD